MKPIAVAEWLAEGRKLFGDDWRTWRFQCPVCKHIQTPANFEAAGVEPQSAYQECIGRFVKAKDGEKSPCDYAAYGLFRLGRVVTSEHGKPVQTFPFAVPVIPEAA